MLSQEREEGEFLGVGGARLEVVGRREVGEEGRLEGGGRTPSHHSLQLSDTLWEGRGDDTLQSLIVMFMFCANLAFSSQASRLRHFGVWTVYKGEEGSWTETSFGY